MSPPAVGIANSFPPTKLWLVEKIDGATPIIVVKDVIRIGLNLSDAPKITASFQLKPSSLSFVIITSSRTIPLFTTIPASRNMARKEIKDKDVFVRNIAKNVPDTAGGIVKSIMNGAEKDSSTTTIDAQTRKIARAISIKRFKKVLDAS